MLNLFLLVRKHKELLIDEEDLQILGKLPASLHQGYVKVHLKDKTVLAHRLILVPPDGYEVDHIDRNGFNNKQSNLRAVTRGENNYNMRPKSDNTSGYKGVHYYKAYNKYQAYINVRGVRMNLGYYETAEAAAQAYNNRAKLLGLNTNLLNKILK